MAYRTSPCLVAATLAAFLRRESQAVVAVAMMLCAALPAQAQTRTRDFSASIDTRLGYNVNSRQGGVDGADWIGEVVPSISLVSRSGRVVGRLNYGLSLVERSRDDANTEVTHRLSSSFSAEAVPQRLYLDGSASISQQSRSAFGVQSAEGSLSSNTNRTQVGAVSLSPVLRGVLGGAINAEARLNVAAQNTRDSLEGDNTQTGGSVSLSSALPGTLITWGLVARTVETDFRVGRTTRNDSATLSLGWQADADWSFSARGGTESQNVQDFDRRSTNTWGVGATWRPSPRTRLQADLDDRFFGRGYGLVAEYRLPRTSFTWTSRRDTSNSGGTIEPITLFDQFMAALADAVPDPVVREAEVRALLAATGLDPAAIVRPGFVTSAVSIAEQHQLSWAWSGQRLSASVQAYRSTSTVIDNLSSALSREPVRLGGYSATLSYRLTPTSSLAATGSKQMTKATFTQPGNNLKSASLTYTSQFGRRTRASLAARYSVFNSTADPYREAAVTASLAMSF